MTLTRLLTFAALAVALASFASAGVAWQSGSPAADGSHQFLFATDGSPAAQEFETNVLGDANVQVFLGSFHCWRLDATQAAAAGLHAPALVIRDGQGHELWRRDSLVQAPELITALVINSPPPAPGQTGAAMAVTSTTTAAGTTTTVTNAGGPVGLAMTPIATDLSGDASDASLDLVSAGWAANGDSLVITVTVAGSAHVEGFHLYLDADSSQATGYNTANILGAECMIEGATIYTHAGAQQTDWNWTPSVAATYQSTGSTLTLTTPLASLGLAHGQTLNLSFGFTDANWAPADWMPDGQPVTVTVP